MPQHPSITENKDGSFSARADHGPISGPREMRTVRAASRRELTARLADIQVKRLRGELVAESTITVAEMIDAWLAAELDGKARNTQVSIRNTLRLPREVLGARQARTVKPDDIRALAKQARESGRHPQHDRFWADAARVCDQVRRAGPAGITPAGLIESGWPSPWIYRVLRHLGQGGRIRQLRKGLWAPLGGDDGRQPTDPGSLRPASRPAGLQADTTRWMVSRLGAAYAQAIADGKLARNPCTGVKVFESRQDRAARKDKPIWDEPTIRKFLAITALHRLAVCWRLTSYGLRRGEVLGLRWEDIEWDAPHEAGAGLLHIRRSRVREGADTAVKPPKSDRSARTLPLDAATLAVLRARKRLEAEERLSAGPAWAGSGYIAVDVLGVPVEPENYSQEFRRITDRAGLPRIRLNDVRHSANSAMAAAGIPAVTRGLFIGNSPTVNDRHYTHARPSDMAEAARIIHGYMNG